VAFARAEQAVAKGGRAFFFDGVALAPGSDPRNVRLVLYAWLRFREITTLISNFYLAIRVHEPTFCAANRYHLVFLMVILARPETFCESIKKCFTPALAPPYHAGDGDLLPLAAVPDGFEIPSREWQE
jgi:hypothetical protein